MLDARRPRPIDPTRRTGRPPRNRVTARSVAAPDRRRMVVIAVLSVLAALLVPMVLGTARSHAATGDPVGSLDSVSITSTGMIHIYGWTADPDQPTTPLPVTFSDNGQALLSWLANQSRPDVGVAYPTYGSNHGFAYDLAVADGTHNICVAAHNYGAGSNAQLGCQSITVHNNPVGTAAAATVVGNTATITGTASDSNTTGAVIVRAYRDGVYAGGTATDPTSHAYQLQVPVAEGPHTICIYVLNVGPGSNLGIGCQNLTVRNNPFGALETAGQTETGVHLKGWAIDLNTTGAILVRAYIDGVHVADTWANQSRPDIGSQYPGEGPNHGYTFDVAAAQGSHSFCVAASNVSYGVSTSLGCQTVTVVNNPIGALESAIQIPGAIRVSGYAIDFNTVGPIIVRAYVDGRYAGGALASASRSDLAAKYPTAGGNHGYAFDLPFSTGSHLVCIYALNVGPGGNSAFPCQRVTINNSPVAHLDWALQYPGGVRVQGWAVDPDTTGSIGVHAYVDGRFAAATTANQSRPGVLGLFPYNGAAHGYSVAVPMTPGRHVLCLYALNVHAGANDRFSCVAVTRLVAPTGVNTALARDGVTNNLVVSGWALDPDTTGAVAVHVLVDGADKATLSANGATSASLAQYPLYGTGHAYSGTVGIDAGEHIVCVVVRNISAGADLRQRCVKITTSGEAAPAMPVGLQAWPGSRQATLSWTAPRSTNAAITGYILTVNGHSAPVPGPVTSVVSYGLTNGVRYVISIRAINRLGTGSAATVVTVPTNIPPQITPAPVSTSHYVRNLTGNLSSDAALMRSTGAADAARNPSGHNYLILLQIGGQDEADGGTVLSATARFVSYPAVVSAMEAYLDGYATRQQPYAPLTLAIGTNNDMDVSASAGASWARNVVNPVAAYAASRHAGMIVAGANDMEPGFRGSVSASRSWLSGYLAATSARFVFNGSADGCSTGVAGSGCNNGWRMSDLQWLAGGAAPTRTISLPQIYNYAMPQQWKYISLTGTNSGHSRINFGGPLTEYTACVQAGGSCGSLPNTTAWSQLWAAISSVPAIRQPQLPNGTDLRIN